MAEGASCISRELGCNNYYLSRLLAHPLSCAHHYISSHHSTSVGWNATAAARCASQIELISGIYRAADFPFVLPLTRPTEYTSDGISLSGRRIRARTTHIRSRGVREIGWPRINFLRIINQPLVRGCGGGALRAPECENRSAESRLASRGRVLANSSVRFKQTFAIGIVTNG